MKYTPLKNKKANMMIMLAVFFVFIIFVILNATLSKYNFLYQIGAIITITVFIQVTARYELPVYSYILDGRNFVVVREQGKKATQLCNIDLSTGIAVMKKAEYMALPGDKKKKVTKCYNYCQNIFTDSYYYVFEFNGIEGLIIAEISEAMAAEISKIISEKTDEETVGSIVDDD